MAWYGPIVVGPTPTPRMSGKVCLRTGDLRVDGRLRHLQATIDVLILDGAEERRPQRANGDHAHAAHRVERQRPTARELLGDDAQSGRPEEGLADTVERGREEDHHA